VCIFRNWITRTPGDRNEPLLKISRRGGGGCAFWGEGEVEVSFRGMVAPMVFTGEKKRKKTSRRGGGESGIFFGKGGKKFADSFVRETSYFIREFELGREEKAALVERRKKGYRHSKREIAVISRKDFATSAGKKRKGGRHYLRNWGGIGGRQRRKGEGGSCILLFRQGKNFTQMQGLRLRGRKKKEKQ